MQPGLEPLGFRTLHVARQGLGHYLTLTANESPVVPCIPRRSSDPMDSLDGTGRTLFVRWIHHQPDDTDDMP
jgi:hypothetical protein